MLKQHSRRHYSTNGRDLDFFLFLKNISIHISEIRLEICGLGIDTQKNMQMTVSRGNSDVVTE